MHSGAKDPTVHSVIQLNLTHDAVLLGGIPIGMPQYWELVREFSQQAAPLIYPDEVRTLGGLSTTQRVFSRLKEEGYILPILVLPTLTKQLVLRGDVLGMDYGTIMVQGGYSMAVENLNILPHREEYSIYCRGLWTLMHTLAKLRKFWRGDSFLVKAILHKIQPLLE